MLFSGVIVSSLLSIAFAGSLDATADTALSAKARDPCAAIAGKKWVAPREVRACFTSFKVDPVIKNNIIEVVNKTLAFHASVNYQIRAPAPFTLDVHEDLMVDLARIRSQSYPSQFDLHIDLSRTLKRLNDGHCVYINACFDSVFLSYVPVPLVLLASENGEQSIYIAPEAFTVASAEFADQLDVWQKALPPHLKGKLQTFSGAKVLSINGANPFSAVNANALITGGYQGFGTRQNAFFATYNLGANGFGYSMGNFGQMALPLTDSVTLTVKRQGSYGFDTITLPYRSRIAVPTTWTDSASFQKNLCTAQAGTNGAAVPQSPTTGFTQGEPEPASPVEKFQQQPPLAPADRRQHALNVLLDNARQQDIVLPPALAPKNPVTGSAGVAQFFLLEDGKTGVLALGSFSDSSFERLQQAMLEGLQNLKAKGAERLIVDVTGNGGGYVCLAHWLHRIIVGPKSTTIPQAGLDTTTRAGPLAQLIVQKIVKENADPGNQLLFNPLNWQFPNGTHFPADYDWLQSPVPKIINGHNDAFSPRMADVCQPFELEPPAEALFDPKKVVIMGNGRCASSCSLFSITMAKSEGVKTAVVGGKKDVQQQYCGIVGGQSTDFVTVDTEIKSTGLKNHTLAPPDFLSNSVQGITWRLGYGIDNPNEPEEWQNHAADASIPLTVNIVNNPPAIWKQVASTVL